MARDTNRREEKRREETRQRKRNRVETFEERARKRERRELGRDWRGRKTAGTRDGRNRGMKSGFRIHRALGGRYGRNTVAGWSR